MKPPIQYAKSGDINIAYQVFGKGTIDIVYIPGWISNIDWMWACPELVDFFTALGKVARVILFDKRGTGLSDRIVESSTLEERMDDIKAVMDAVKSESAVLFGHSEGGSVSALFSATYPNRVLALIAFGIFAKRRYSKDYPWAPTDEERQKVYDMIENNWGSGKMYLQSLVPSKANDIVFMDWLANYFRSGASPTAALKLTKMNTHVNIIDILEYVKVPTLLMQRTNDIDVKIDEGKFIAARIKNSKFVEFDGKDHLFWAGNTKEVIDEIKQFINNLKPKIKYTKGLVSVLFCKTSTDTKAFFKPALTESFIAKYQGKLIKNDKNVFVAIFRVPGKASHCAIDLVDSFKSYQIEAKMGVYIREGLLNTKNKVTAEDEYLIKNMSLQNRTNQVLATQSIKRLLSGASFNFVKDSAIIEYNTQGLCKLYTVDKEKSKKSRNSNSLPQYDSFLEQVVTVINQNLNNSMFGVETLSQEVGLSERQLQRKLKELTGKSPCQLITSTRLNKAKKALLAKKHTVSQVAFQYGFTSPSYFSKCFKKEFGITPKEVI